MKKIKIVFILLIIIPVILQAAPYKKKGVTVTIKEFKEYREATGVGIINGTPKEVWDVITDYKNTQDFMPNTKKSIVLKREGNKIWVKLTVGAAFFRSTLTIRNHEEIKYKKLSFKQVKGSFQVNRGYWILTPYGKNKTKASYSVALAHKLMPNWIAIKLTRNSMPDLFVAIRNRVIKMRK